VKRHLTDEAVYNDVREILQKARTRAYTAVNTAMVQAYWNIGRRIVEEEQKGKERAEYGQNLIKNLSIALNDESGKGFSVANLWNFKKFYQTFPEPEKLYTLCRELSWSHIRLIMRQDTHEARECNRSRRLVFFSKNPCILQKKTLWFET